MFEHLARNSQRFAAPRARSAVKRLCYIGVMLALVPAVAVPPPAFAGSGAQDSASAGSEYKPEPVYWDVFEKIKDEAFARSEVMENASWLTDVFGPRNSKSSGYVAASEWARQKLEDYGLTDAHMEPFEFAVGWENKYTSIHMTSPQYLRIIGYPAGWSAGTDGKILAPVKHVDLEAITSEADLEQYRGQLDGYILLVSPIQPAPTEYEYVPTSFTEEELDEMSAIPVPGSDSGEARRRRARGEGLTREQKFDFVFAEGALAVVRPDGRDGFGYGLVDAAVNGYAMRKRMWEADAPPPITEVVVAVEHYNRMVRILEKGVPVEMELEIRVDFLAGDPVDFNVIAEIPGTDLAHEIVIIGAHLQSEPVGTGAIDDAAGVVAVMEAARILKSIGAQPRRTIRVGLWGGHEMGVVGNRSHVAANFADVETQEYKKDYDNFSAYFNLDIGTGRIVGVSIMGSELLRSILSEWMKPLRSLGMTHLFTSGMQHEAYEEVGLPGFYFDHDRRLIDDMNSHTNMDVYDRLVPDGLIQASVVLATFAYHAAMRDEKLPRPHPRPW
jgi:carboxypeptidase Q